MKTTKNERPVSKFDVAVHKAEILKSLSDELDSFTHNFMKYESIGEEQDTEWNSDTCKYEPAWQDDEHTIPVMTKVCGWVCIPEDSMTDGQRAWRVAVESVQHELENLL